MYLRVLFIERKLSCRKHPINQPERATSTSPGIATRPCTPLLLHRRLAERRLVGLLRCRGDACEMAVLVLYLLSLLCCRKRGSEKAEEERSSTKFEDG